MKQIRADGTLVDTRTGEIEEARPQPRWDPNRPSPGEERFGANPSHKLPRTLPGGRERRGGEGRDAKTAPGTVGVTGGLRRLSARQVPAAAVRAVVSAEP